MGIKFPLEIDGERERERQTDRQTERQRETERDRERQREYKIHSHIAFIKRSLKVEIETIQIPDN